MRVEFETVVPGLGGNGVCYQRIYWRMSRPWDLLLCSNSAILRAAARRFARHALHKRVVCLLFVYSRRVTLASHIAAIEAVVLLSMLLWGWSDSLGECLRAYMKM